MPENLPGWVSLIKDVGGYGALIVVLWGLKQRWWVPGWVYDDSTKACTEATDKLLTDRDFWRDRFMAAMDSLEGTLQRRGP